MKPFKLILATIALSVAGISQAATPSNATCNVLGGVAQASVEARDNGVNIQEAYATVAASSFDHHLTARTTQMYKDIVWWSYTFKEDADHDARFYYWLVYWDCKDGILQQAIEEAKASAKAAARSLP